MILIAIFFMWLGSYLSRKSPQKLVVNPVETIQESDITKITEVVPEKATEYHQTEEGETMVNEEVGVKEQVHVEEL